MAEDRCQGLQAALVAALLEAEVIRVEGDGGNFWDTPTPEEAQRMVAAALPVLRARIEALRPCNEGIAVSSFAAGESEAIDRVLALLKGQEHACTCTGRGESLQAAHYKDCPQGQEHDKNAEQNRRLGDALTQQGQEHATQAGGEDGS